MKKEEKIQAKKLRHCGYSINEIRKKLNVAKSSVSLWVRDIELTEKQQQKLSERGIKKAVIEQRRKTRLTNENNRRQKIVDSAQKQISKLSKQELWLTGTALYWAEGSKTSRGIVSFSNSDPNMIKLMMIYFRKICKVPEEKFRGYLHIHPHLNYKKAERYWSSLTNISQKQFFKTHRIISKASQQKKDTLPCGTFNIYVCNTELFLKIQGWIQGIYKKTT